MNRNDAMPYVSFAVDNALSERSVSEIPTNARLVGWQCGSEPMFVAVWSYLGGRLDADEAEEIAADLLGEKNWFADGVTPADYVI